MDENELLAACIRGDRVAQRQLYEKFAARLMAVGMRYSRSRADAEDILQESFIKIFKNLSNLRERSNIGAWMKKIVINTAINHQRGKLYLFPMIDVEKINKSYDESVALSDYRLDELFEMIRKLPLGCQIIFNLFAIEGFSHKEIAGKLNISEGTSKSQYSRAKMLLQMRIAEDRKNSYEKLR
jgi:RNA polymerase sigma-70 factor (ECF subfamily)